LRSFIAIELPDSAQSALSDFQKELKKTGAAVRWVKPENIHLTLKFLGNVEEKSVDSIVRIIKGTCNKFEPFSLEMKGAGVFPNFKAPRVIWVGVNGGKAVAGIQNQIENELIPLGFDKEKRTFTPHVTIGRFKSSQGRKPLKEKIDLFKENSFGVIDVTSVSLMRSDLGPAGARYTPLAEVPLRCPDTSGK